MKQAERMELLKRKQSLERMMQTHGWQLVELELDRLREQAIISLPQVVDSHPKMSQYSGRLALIAAITTFIERTIRDGTEAARTGDTSSDDEE